MDIRKLREGSISDVMKGEGPTLENALETHNDYMDNQREPIKTEKFLKAMGDFYTSFEQALEKRGINPDDKTEGKHEEVREALTDALLDYFAVTEGYVAEKAKGMIKKGVKTERVFDFLASQYDLQTGGMYNEKHKSIKGLYKMAKDKDTTGAKLKSTYQQVMMPEHADWAMVSVDQAKFKNHFGHLKDEDWHDYVMPRLEKAGLEVDSDEEHLFYQLKPDKLYSLTQALEKGQWGEKGHKGYHLARKDGTDVN